MRKEERMSTMVIHEENEEDLFDLLPDALLLTIFDKLQDAKSLSISSSLCRRFRSLTTQTHRISLTIPPQKHHKPWPIFSRNQFIRFLNAVFLNLRKISKWNPIRTQKKSDTYNCSTCSYPYSPSEILRNFTEIKELEIRLPSHGGGGDSDSLLKWRAEFGSRLKNCLIVGGISLSPISPISPIRNDRDGNEIDNVDDAIRQLELYRMTNDDLKLRIVWIISSLIAASTRHCLLEEAIKQKKLLSKVVITDDIDQGKVCMNGEQVEEMRRDTEVLSSTKMPTLKVKMWYSSELELPEAGCVMKGATLVVIKPVEEWSKADDGGDLVAKGLGVAGDGKEGKVFDEVARELVKLERSYSLEMNSF